MSANQIGLPKRTEWTILLSRIAFSAYVFQMAFFMATKIYQPFMTPLPLINFIVIAIPAVTLSFSFGYFTCKTFLLKRIFLLKAVILN